MKPFPLSFWKSGRQFGSANFNATSWLTVPASTDWAVGTSDFTVEWFHNQSNSGTENYIFDLGISETMAFSIPSGAGRVRVYMGGAIVLNPTVTLSNNTWYHFAISRNSGTLRLFQNGTLIGTVSDSTNITDSTSTLYIGVKDPANPTSDQWPGYMTNFHFVKGTGLYTANFSRPTTNIPAVANSKLLLWHSTSSSLLTDSSGTGKTVTNVNSVTWSSLTPF